MNSLPRRHLKDVPLFIERRAYRQKAPTLVSIRHEALYRDRLPVDVLVYSGSPATLYSRRLYI